MKQGFTISLIFLVSIGLYSQVPAGQREIGIELTFAENNSWDSAFVHGYQACMRNMYFSFDWSALEPAPTQYDSSMLGMVGVLDYYLHAYGVKLQLNLHVINTVKREVPPDLDSVPYDSPLFIQRFTAMFDTVLAYLPHGLESLIISNESDVALSEDSLEMESFKRFLDTAAAYCRVKYQAVFGKPLAVGTALTWDGLTNPVTASWWQRLNETMDFIAVTYYPVSALAQVRNPSVVPQEWAQLISLYPDTSRPVRFVECGYPSSPVLQSNDSLQAAFIHEVFNAWDQHASRIDYVSFFMLTDWSQSYVDTLAVYYGLPNHLGFKEFLRTLGLRTYPGNGQDKPAYRQLQCEANSRGFCSAPCLVSGVEDEITTVSGAWLVANPVTDQLRLTGPVSSGRLVLTDLSGRVIRMWEEIPATGQRSLPVAGLPSGTYLLTVTGKSGQPLHTVKVIKL